MTGPRYNPVVKNGTFEVTCGKTVKRYKAVDAAGAKWKLLTFLGLEYTQANWSSIDVKTLTATKRQFD